MSAASTRNAEDPSAERAALARLFAIALRHLRDTWDVHYVPGRTPGRHAVGDTSTRTSSDVATGESARGVGAPLRDEARQWTPETKLEYLRRKNIGDCRRCGLCQTRTNIVFGVGSPRADIMFVGEAPGADEDRKGEPFVGRAGQLLDAWLRELEVTREEVYIANVLKCRPPGNRDPKPDEIATCSPFLRAQIRAIEPKVIVALGRHAGMLLSRREDLGLRAMRSTRLTYDPSAGSSPSTSSRIPLIVTYHPAYVLRQQGGGSQGTPQPGRETATELVMQDLRRALDIARRGA